MFYLSLFFLCQIKSCHYKILFFYAFLSLRTSIFHEILKLINPTLSSISSQLQWKVLPCAAYMRNIYCKNKSIPNCIEGQYIHMPNYSFSYKEHINSIIWIQTSTCPLSEEDREQFDEEEPKTSHSNWCVSHKTLVLLLIVTMRITTDGLVWIEEKVLT